MKKFPLYIYKQCMKQHQAHFMHLFEENIQLNTTTP